MRLRFLGLDRSFAYRARIYKAERVPAHRTSGGTNDAGEIAVINRDSATVFRLCGWSLSRALHDSRCRAESHGTSGRESPDPLPVLCPAVHMSCDGR